MSTIAKYCFISAVVYPKRATTTPFFSAWVLLAGGNGHTHLKCSKTINNDHNRVPSAFEFGSHVGIGLRVARNHTLGIGIQHLSNAGIKQPNGGIDLLLVQYTVSTGTPNR